MSLINSAKLAKFCFNKHPVLYTVVRNHWNKDYKPGPYPKTQAEREAAAKKYGLDISEYKPYPDDGLGLGDYPKLPDISGDSKDSFYPWDFPELKRNFNEPLHARADIIGEDRYDISAKLRHSHFFYFAQFFGVMFISYVIYYILSFVEMFPAVLPKQYPCDDKKHYTYELED